MTRELANRQGEGIEVWLHWDSADGRLTVSVEDSSVGEYFELEARPDEALEVFYHPYAYAPGVATRRTSATPTPVSARKGEA